MEKKYKLTDETININGITLYRIEALKDFSDVKKGDKGGFVESENNLSHDGDCWVYDDAKVSDCAMIFDNVKIFDNVEISEHAEIYDNAVIKDLSYIYGKSKVSNNVVVFGNAQIRDAIIKEMADYIVFKNWWSSGRYFTWTRSNNMWSVGCFYGTGEELIAKAYNDSESSGREYERIVKYVESIFNKEHGSN